MTKSMFGHVGKKHAKEHGSLRGKIRTHYTGVSVSSRVKIQVFSKFRRQLRSYMGFISAVFTMFNLSSSFANISSRNTSHTCQRCFWSLLFAIITSWVVRACLVTGWSSAVEYCREKVLGKVFASERCYLFSWTTEGNSNPILVLYKVLPPD